MSQISIADFNIIRNHPYMRAVASVNIGGLWINGLRLEQSGRDQLTLGFPGRKIRGSWQVMYQPECPKLESLLLTAMTARYNQNGVAA